MNSEQKWNWEEEYRSLLKALLVVGEEIKGRPTGDDNKFSAAEGLLFKVFDLSCTALNLFKNNVKCYDVADYYHPVSAINIIARAAYEAFLVFNYVYVAAKDTSDEELRYWLWKRNSLLEWRNDAARSSEAAKLVPMVVKEIHDAEDIITKNDIYCGLNTPRQKELLKLNKWKPTWGEIAKEAGISEMYRQQMYPYLCGYAHSSFRSIIQIQDASDKSEREKLLIVSIKFIMISMGLFSTRYLAIWGHGTDILIDDQKRTVDIWTGVAMKEL